MAKHAERLLKEFRTEADRNMGDPVYGPLWQRAFEIAVKVAAVLSLGDGYKIEKVHAVWAVGTVRWCNEQMQKLLVENMADSEFDASVKKTYKYIKEARKYTNDQRFVLYTKKGLMPDAKLLKLMKCKPKDLREYTATLKARGDIETNKVKSKNGNKEIVVHSLTGEN